MLKTIGGKRKSRDEHDGQAIVPAKDAMVFGEVVATGHKRSCAGVDENAEQPDLRYIGWLLREKLNDFVDGDHRASRAAESKLRGLLSLAASCKVVSVDAKMMSPVLWRTLPQELLLRVFAHLPLPDITRLRFLSKEWNRDMGTVNSEINRACDETSPIVVVGFKRARTYLWFQELLVKMCAQKMQYSYRLNYPVWTGHWDDMGAVDHGLVCFVSIWKPSKSSRVRIIVANLLTRVWRELPPRHYVYSSPPQMMHIKVDPETKCYEVVVVDKNARGHRSVEIYDSGTGKWRLPTPPLRSIFGFAHTWLFNTGSRNFRSRGPIRMVYDFAERRLKRYDEEGPSEGASVILHTHHQDCMFVLHKNTPKNGFLPVGGYCIAKYRIQNNAKDWIQERSYSLCSPLETLLEKNWHSMTLNACEDFAMVFTHPSGECEHLWLLDLATGEWSTLPHSFEKMDVSGRVLMTRAFWNVVP